MITSIDLSKYSLDNSYKNSLKSSINLDFDFGYFLGCYIGNGCISLQKSGKASCIMFANIDTGVNSKYTSVLNTKLFNKLTINTYSREHIFNGKSTPWITTDFSSIPLGTFLVETVGNGSSNKKLPDFTLNTPECFRWGLLSGLLDTDGSVSNYLRKYKDVSEKFRCNISYASISQTLITNIKDMLDSLNIKYIREHLSGTCYILGIKEVSFTYLFNKINLFNTIKLRKVLEAKTMYVSRICR